MQFTRIPVEALTSLDRMYQKEFILDDLIRKDDDYKISVELPDGQTSEFHTNIFDEFLQNDTTDLRYYVDKKEGRRDKTIKVIIIPIVESA